MSVPQAGILLSPVPALPSSPRPAMEDAHIDEPMLDAHSMGAREDETSRKSFKRKYRKLLNKYLTIRANNQTLHQTYQRAIATASQLSNENAYILDYIQELDPDSRPQSPPGDQDFAPPSPSTFNRDAHFGYSPTPSPPPEIATQLTTEQLGLGMFKVEGLSHGMMASTHREDDPEAFRGRGSIGSGGTGIASGGRNSARTGMTSVLPAIPRRKRKDRESDVDDNLAQSNRKRGRG